MNFDQSEVVSSRAVSLTMGGSDCSPNLIGTTRVIAGQPLVRGGHQQQICMFSRNSRIDGDSMEIASVKATEHQWLHCWLVILHILPSCYLSWSVSADQIGGYNATWA